MSTPRQGRETGISAAGVSFRQHLFSLRAQLPLMLLLLTTVILGYMYRVALRHDRLETEGDMLRGQAASAIALQSDLEYFLRRMDMPHIQVKFSELSPHANIRAALLADEHGKVLAASEMSWVGREATSIALYAGYAGKGEPPDGQTRLSSDHRLVVSVYPVLFDSTEGAILESRRTGTLFWATDTSSMLDERYARTDRWMLQISSMVGMVALLFWLILHLVVSRRVGKLLQAMERAEQHWGKMIHSGVSGHDEIGRLGMSFDSMMHALVQSSAQVRELSQAVEQSASSIIITNRDGLIEYVNPAFTVTTGYAREEAIGKKTSLLQSGFTPGEVYQGMWETLRAGAVWRGEIQNQRKDGSLYWDSIIITPVRDEEGEVTHFVAVQEDVTARKEADVQLQLFLRVVSHANEAITITDVDRNIVFVNPAFLAITGYSAEEVMGKNPRVLHSGLMDEVFYEEMWSNINETGKWQGEIIDRRKNGESYVAWLSISTINDESGEVSYYIALFSDISARKAAEERIIHVAQHDFLTGLPNRMLLQDRLEQAIRHAEREKLKVAVLFFDLDRFKSINDTLGHLIGDKLLREVAARISGASRASDTVCRQGGDEFVIVLPELVSADDVPSIAIKLLRAVAGSYSIEELEVEVTTSIGISLYPEDGADGDTLLKHADTAMYHAKECGRNNFQFFTRNMTTRAMERSATEMKLHHALERNEFLLHYQPQVDRASGDIIGVEALLRWNNPGAGMIMPGQFIPIAEESGMIVPIGEWVLREACRQNMAWRKLGLPPITVAVNLSAVQFRQKNLGEVILNALYESGLPPSGLELEITESAVIRDSEAAILLLYELKDLGVKLAMDDFGTGYSSLGYLKLLPIDKLKIDQSFVRDMMEDQADAALVSTIINMARNLNLKPMAEGVETSAQLDMLAQYGCDEIQGYYFSKPVPPDEFVAFFRRHLGR
ncbi:MAG: EAL domain-containing protein [Nitrosomonadales bacterium]|nr:EAL domain-containing protein [Nitrosomonadales bacterium]